MSSSASLSGSGSGLGLGPGPRAPKRKASGSPMGPPEGPPEKKHKRVTPIEARLEKMRHTVAGFNPSWEESGPVFFTKQMHHTQQMMNQLAPEMVEEFVASGEAAELLQALNMQHNNLRTAPIPPGPIKEMYDHMISYMTRVLESLQALMAQPQVKPTPSDFAADSKIWNKFQQRHDAILCRRPANQTGWPIPLMHRAFCAFTHHFHQPTLDEHTPKYLLMAGELCSQMPSAFDNEVARRDAFEAIFQSLDESLTPHGEYQLSGIDKISTVKESGVRPDVARSILWSGGTLVLMLEEFINEVGDSYMQICRSYEVLCGDPKVKLLVEFGNPMFLLCILGPYFMVCGAVKRKNVHVQPLTTLIPMFPDYGIEGHQVQLGYCLQALKAGLDALQTFWQDVGITGNTGEERIQTPQDQESSCPDNGLLRFDGWQGRFVSPMHTQRFANKAPCFRATLHKDRHDVQVVVKFIYHYKGTYGKAVHEYLHGLTLAPRLYSAVNLHPGLVMVVMEYLGFEEGIGGWVELDTLEHRMDDIATPVRKKIETIIDYLQGQGMVHADLRPKNIMIQVDAQRHIVTSANEPVLSLIDFDWAGTVGEACYPPLLNPHIPWPTGTKAYGKVGQEDDRILLNNWWDAFVQPAKHLSPKNNV